MFRLLLYFVVLIICSIGLVKINSMPGTIVMNWEDWRIETSLIFALFITGGTLLGIFLLYHVFDGIITAPKRIFGRHKQANHERGLSVLTEAFAALSVADLNNAKKLTRRAEKMLDNPPITQLLNAQLAKLEGDEDRASQYLKPLLNHKETKFIAARSLLEQARKSGEVEKALAYAETAENMRPDSSYATLALIDLYTKSKSWQRALDVLQKAKKHKALNKEEVNRYAALINYQHALDLYDREEDDLSVGFAKQAHKALPNMVPAAHLLARIYARIGQKQQAVRVLNLTWRQFPHPSLANLLRRLFSDDSATKRLKRVEKMVSSNLDNIESQIAIAEAALDAREFNKARNHLKIALSKQETPRICKLMARLEEQESHNKEKADMWVERAVKANIGPSWTCTSCHAIPDSWTLHCPECNSFDSIEWKINKLNFVDVTSSRVPEPISS